MRVIKKLYNSIFNKVTKSKLLKLGFKIDEDGTFIMGRYKIPNKKELDEIPKFRFNIQTHEMLYLTNAVITNVKTMDLVEAVIKFDTTYQKIKKTNIYNKENKEK